MGDDNRPAEAGAVLVVGDDPEIMGRVREALEPLGVELTEAERGSDALDRFEAESFDLVFLEVGLPDTTGLQVLAEFRERADRPAVVIIAEEMEPEDAIEAVRLGANDFLVAPVDVENIKDIARRLLERPSESHDLPAELDELLDRARRHLHNRAFDLADSHIDHALEIAPTSAEAFNLKGVLTAMRGQSVASQRFFRAALALNPPYAPARANLERVTSHTNPTSHEQFDLGEDEQG